MLKNLTKNWKTSSAGVLMIGSAIVQLTFAIRGGGDTESAWNTALIAVVGGIGLIFAGDSSAPAKPIEPPK
jgi:hypothetical protein